MSVDTKAIISQSVSVIDVKYYLESKYENVEVINTSMPDIFIITFTDGADNRQMWYYSGTTTINDVEINATRLSIGCWGNAVTIIKGIVEHFGGYIDESDSDDIDFYPVNIEKFNNDNFLDPLDKFKHKIIQAVGFNNLNAVLKLCQEYEMLDID